MKANTQQPGGAENQEAGVKMLNALSHEYNQWQTTCSQYDRIDEFGVQIPAGEPHYKLGFDTGADVQRLSRSSMQTFTTLLFSRNPELSNLAADRCHKQWNEMLDKLNAKRRSRSDGA
jgi:hypothetical protein